MGLANDEKRLQVTGAVVFFLEKKRFLRETKEVTLRFFDRYRINKLSAELMEFYIARKTSAKCGLSSEKVRR